MPTSADASQGCDILVGEAEPETRQILWGILGRRRVEWVGTAAEGEGFLRREECHLVICADELPDLPGLMLFAAIRDLRAAT